MENNKETNKQVLDASELRRKIIKEAKRLFLNPEEESVAPKEKSPTKKQIIAILTPEELEYLRNNINQVFPVSLPEREFWEAFKSKNMENRKRILLRMVAGDNYLKFEKSLLEKTGSLPPKTDIYNLLEPDERNIMQEMKTPISSTEMSLNLLSAKDREYYLRNGTLQTEKSIDTDLQELYIKYVESQRKPFKIYINFINNLLCELKKYRLVHDSTKMSARIKASDSAVNNDQEQKKSLDDVFGLEIDFSNESEKELITQIVASTINITKERPHEKPNGYIAYHCSGYPSDIEREFEDSRLHDKCRELFSGEIYFNNLMKNVKTISQRYKIEMIAELKKSCEIDDSLSDLTAIVEFQFKTIHVALDAIDGPASHWQYKMKHKNSGNENEESEENQEEESKEKQEEELKKFMKEIQEKYTLMIKMFGKIPLSQVATMWESTLRGEPLRQLSSMEVVKHIYPFFIDPKDLEELEPEVSQEIQPEDELR